MTSLRIGALVLAGASTLLLVVASVTVAREARAAATAATAAPAASPAVVVYDQADFKGRALTIAGPTPDLGSVGFDNKVASFTIQGGGDWVLCENKNYTGRCVRVQGQAGDLSLLQLSGRVSSLYPVPATPAP
jgi:hypothetical protein